MYSFESRLRYSETDHEGKLSVLAMMNYLQDCSTFQSEALGLGPRAMEPQGKAWFLAAWDILIDRLPEFGEKLVISTWAYEFKGIYGKRNFTIRGAEGASFVRADSLWFLFDKDKGRPCRAERGDVARYLEGSAPRLDMPPLERKLETPEEGIAAEPLRVEKYHLDSNLHMNNAQYVEVAREALEQKSEALEKASALSAEELRRAKLLRLEVQYKKAAVAGDMLFPFVGCDRKGSPGRCFVDLRGGQGESYAAVRMEFG